VPRQVKDFNLAPPNRLAAKHFMHRHGFPPYGPTLVQTEQEPRPVPAARAPGDLVLRYTVPWIIIN
jgi:hypothetical protein